MSGIYIHIPFCKQACNYCDFHFSTSLQHKAALVNGILTEIDLRQHYLPDKQVETIYFGGGTPSLLSEKELFLILEKLYKTYRVSADVELTMECNPDDVSVQKLKELKRAEVNRLSIGLQSFHDEELIWMNRAHSAKESEASVKRAQDMGFENITIDLIYGSKFCNVTHWKHTLNKAIALDVKHISSYNLTVEEKTKLGREVAAKKERGVDDEKSAELFVEMVERLEKSGFIHYEISNFGKEHFFSQHNANYWKGLYYLGFGPSAHSFNGTSRQWNVSNNHLYIKRVAEKTDLYFEKELLSETNRFNEYILTGLRTMWGISMSYLKQHFSSECVSRFLTQVKAHEDNGNILLKDGSYTLTSQGKLLADKITSDVFV